jgi:uncharacterized membrane protein
MLNRLKNYGLWVAIVALVLDVLIYSGVVSIADKQTVTELVQRFLELLVLAGILNNPSIGTGFKDPTE